MKKNILGILFVVLLLFPCAGKADQPISQGVAISLASHYLREIDGMTEEDFQTYQITNCYQNNLNGEPVWAVEFDGDEDDPRYAINTYVVYVNIYSGAYCGATLPYLYNPVTQAFLDICEINGSFFTWTPKQKYAFSQTYPQIVKDFEEQALLDGKNYLDTSSQVLQLLEFDYRLPDENCISQTEAAAYARQALKQAEGLTEEEIAYWYGTHNFYSFLYSYAFCEEGRLVWKVIYFPARPGCPDRGYYVEVDAYTGEVLGVRLHDRRDPWATEVE